MTRPTLRDPYCGKTPAELDCYAAHLTTEDGTVLYPSADDYVWAEEGTLDRRTGLFACDDCYIALGMPTAPGGWKPPDMNDMASIVGTPAEWAAMDQRPWDEGEF